MNAKAFAFLLALLAVAGCAPNRSSLSIQAACYPTDDCTFAATCDMQFIGTYQIPANGILWVPIQVANQLPENGDVGVGRVNSNDAHVNGAIVEFDGNERRLHYVRRPFQREPDFGVTSVNYDFAEILSRAKPPH